MQFPSLIHLVKVVQAFAKGQEIIVLGSSSLLASHPDLGDSGNVLESSLDADLLLADCDELLAQVLEESVGADSLFQSRNGYHADILRPMITELLPAGWRQRLVPLKDCTGIFCLEPHDLAVAKLQVGRPKDISLLAVLLATHLLDPSVIRERLDKTLLAESMVVLVFRRLAEAATLSGGPD